MFLGYHRRMMQSYMGRGVPSRGDELLLVIKTLIELPAEVGLVLAPERVLLGLVVKVQSGDLLLGTHGG
jgi:hypothetical protein